MNTKKLILTGLMALASSALIGHAQINTGIPDLTIASVNAVIEGDLILGARNGSATKDLVVDLGNVSAYRSATPGTTYNLPTGILADFSTAFGVDAFSTGTTWSVIAGNGGAGADPSTGNKNNTLWATTPWVGSTYASLNSGTAQGSVSTKLDGFANSLIGNTSLSYGGSTLLDTKLGNSYTKEIGPANPFGYFPTAVEGNTAGVSKLELWELLPVLSGSPKGIDLGTFTLNSSASTLTFTAFTAIPEPSTYAAILGLATLGVVMIRRRKQAQAQV